MVTRSNAECASAKIAGQGRAALVHQNEGDNLVPDYLVFLPALRECAQGGPGAGFDGQSGEPGPAAFNLIIGGARLIDERDLAIRVRGGQCIDDNPPAFLGEVVHFTAGPKSLNGNVVKGPGFAHGGE